MKKLILLLAVAVSTLTACTKFDDPTGHHDRLQKLLLKDTVQLYVGEVKSVPITISPSDYNLDSLKYTSSDTSVVTISMLGVLTAKSVGASTISISNFTNTISVTTHITVVPAPIDSLQLGLIAFFPFNNSTADLSGKGNNGTGYYLTSVADRFGNPNAAYHFDGDSSYVVGPDNLYMRLYNTDFTQNAWVKLDDYNSSYGSVVLGKRIPGIADAGYTFSLGGYTTSSSFNTKGFIHLGPGGGSNFNALGTKPVLLNDWHMVSCVYSMTNQTVSIYLDGVLDTMIPNITPPNASIGSKFYIGRDNPNTTDNGYFLKGDIDDVRMYNRALSSDEILKLFHLLN